MWNHPYICLVHVTSDTYDDVILVPPTCPLASPHPLLFSFSSLSLLAVFKSPFTSNSAGVTPAPWCVPQARVTIVPHLLLSLHSLVSLAIHFDTSHRCSTSPTANLCVPSYLSSAYCPTLDCCAIIHPHIFPSILSAGTSPRFYFHLRTSELMHGVSLYLSPHSPHSFLPFITMWVCCWRNKLCFSFSLSLSAH